MSNVIKIYKVTMKFAMGRPRIAFVEALSFNDAAKRVIAEAGHRPIEGVETMEGYALLVPMNERERAEIEADATRLGLNGTGEVAR